MKMLHSVLLDGWAREIAATRSRRALGFFAFDLCHRVTLAPLSHISHSHCWERKLTKSFFSIQIQNKRIPRESNSPTTIIFFKSLVAVKFSEVFASPKMRLSPSTYRYAKTFPCFLKWGASSRWRWQEPKRAAVERERKRKILRANLLLNFLRSNFCRIAERKLLARSSRLRLKVGFRYFSSVSAHKMAKYSRFSPLEAL